MLALGFFNVPHLMPQLNIPDTKVNIHRISLIYDRFVYNVTEEC